MLNGLIFLNQLFTFQVTEGNSIDYFDDDDDETPLIL